MLHTPTPIINHSKAHITFITFYIPPKHRKYETDPKIGKDRFKLRKPSFPYLERASKKSLTPNSGAYQL